MSNIVNAQSGERLSFYKLFYEKKYRILIPIIQRDYAQGRKTTREIRVTFLDALYKYLDENKPNRDLDFVYGSLNDVSGVTDFIPLDGQQRLTTLFLLHWYLFQISDNTEKKEEFKKALLKDGRSNFTYETRSSSSEFCDALINYNIDFNILIDLNCKIESLSKIIKNCSWYYLSWKYDPTIQSMLTMLDAIHEKFSGQSLFFERLIDLNNPIITFLFLNLKDFKLTDDLYIKMNSRGKSLTAFENFKAKFEQYLDNVNHGRSFTLKFGNKNNAATLKEYFSYNIDTKWANLFWNYRTLQNSSNTEKDDTFDDELINFIRIIFANQYAMNVEVLSKDKDDTLEYLLGTNVARKEIDYSDLISFNKYEELNVLNTDSILYLIDAFDNLVNGNERIKLQLSGEYRFYFDENKVFENALRHNFDSNQERLCFHAYVRYLIINKGDITGIEQWMRVIHNLTHPENTVIDNASEVAAAIKSIEELLPYSKNILEHLKSDINILTFSSWQILEEKIKAHLITKSKEWKNRIEKIEKHKYFNGQIGFIIEFSGILEYFKTNHQCDWDNIKDKEFFDKFSSYSDKASQTFEASYENRMYDIDYVFERAVLTKGDYLSKASQNRYNLLSTNLVKNNIKRDHSWKKLLRISEDENWTNKRKYVQNVFDDYRFNISDIINSLTDICNDKTNTWRDYLINCPSLIAYCKQGFIRFNNDNDILLYGESQSNHIHSEMYSFYIWKKYVEPNIESFKPFENVFYNEVKSIEDEACILFDGLLKNRIYYHLCLYYSDNDNLPSPYELVFRKVKGDNLPDKYGDTIKEILNNCDFSWNEEYSGYFFTCNESDKLINKLHQLTELLKKDS